MKKVLLIGVLTTLAFAASLLGSLAMTGNLNREAFERLSGMAEEDGAGPGTAPADTFTAEARALNLERTRLTEWEASLTEWETQLNQREQTLDATLAQVQEVQTQLNASLDTLDAEQVTRMNEVAKRIGAMKATIAAEALEDMEPRMAAKILMLIKDRGSGKILDAMKDLRRRSTIIQFMQERPL